MPANTLRNMLFPNLMQQMSNARGGEPQSFESFLKAYNVTPPASLTAQPQAQPPPAPYIPPPMPQTDMSQVQNLMSQFFANRTPMPMSGGGSGMSFGLLGGGNAAGKNPLVPTRPPWAMNR